MVWYGTKLSIFPKMTYECISQIKNVFEIQQTSML